ncbi:MAG: hypothetical protein R3A79_20535 [Nannocystaceae bacterium]
MRTRWRWVGGVLCGLAAACSGGDETSATTSTSTTTTTTGESTGEAPGCGDGIVQAGEACDDGDANADDAACTADCTVNVCGDGKVGPGESCDAPGDPACTDDCRAVLFADDAENGDGDWEHALVDDPGCDEITGYCAEDLWVRIADGIDGNPDPDSVRSWTSGDLSLVRGPMSSRLMTPEIDLSAAQAPVILEFDHSVNFKDIGVVMPYSDGSVVELAVDGGDFGYVAMDGYTAAITDAGMCASLPDSPVNPLLGVTAFVGQYNGWSHEAVDLSAHVGAKIRLGFRVASDCAAADGPFELPVVWYLDNVRVSAHTSP